MVTTKDVNLLIENNIMPLDLLEVMLTNLDNDGDRIDGVRRIYLNLESFRFDDTHTARMNMCHMMDSSRYSRDVLQGVHTILKYAKYGERTDIIKFNSKTGTVQHRVKKFLTDVVLENGAIFGEFSNVIADALVVIHLTALTKYRFTDTVDGLKDIKDTFLIMYNEVAYKNALLIDIDGECDRTFRWLMRSKTKSVKFELLCRNLLFR